MNISNYKEKFTRRTKLDKINTFTILKYKADDSLVIYLNHGKGKTRIELTGKAVQELREILNNK